MHSVRVYLLICASISAFGYCGMTFDSLCFSLQCHRQSYSSLDSFPHQSRECGEKYSQSNRAST